jgi:hypothetical protein
MGGGTVAVIEIGDSILYVAGSIGMALAARTKQIDFVTLWAKLVLPPAEDQGERLWYDVFPINYWQTEVTGRNSDPYGFIVQTLELDDVKAFFEDQDHFRRSLFGGNLLHSLTEFKREAASADYNERLGSRYWRPNVMPVWCLMKPKEFQNEVWRIFGSSADVINFACPGIIPSPEKLWPLWQAWKVKCVQVMSDGGRYHDHLHNVSWLNLPGEPQLRK